MNFETGARVGYSNPTACLYFRKGEPRHYCKTRWR